MPGRNGEREMGPASAFSVLSLDGTLHFERSDSFGKQTLSQEEAVCGLLLKERRMEEMGQSSVQRF